MHIILSIIFNKVEKNKIQMARTLFPSFRTFELITFYFND